MNAASLFGLCQTVNEQNHTQSLNLFRRPSIAVTTIVLLAPTIDVFQGGEIGETTLH
ncbi:uncharacterized protein M421DRAFT_421054 [Didymella exigua CBS 183.55]|uniref:Uncharacterized protein n=1 Tax=Didymella exigua CBS 183.55 TaxID=1150837 RepID=A0A6A5RJS2_9PLEO|nr:uncharacterized protein M421DRAFT_421054 [Didymella exigua CBS 183.55]KAF1927859.1 hypothetical protein M421DRAFT_421054 [Didymella exigua CBS 183.55]